MKKNDHKNTLINKKLRITPQRIAVLEAVNELQNHPTAEDVSSFIKKKHPNIAVGTVYKTLETFVEKGLIEKVKTAKDVMRYDAIFEKHHHLYCEDTEHIEDFFDDKLNNMLEEYFKEKKIPNFKIKDIKLQIIGTFNDKKK